MNKLALTVAIMGLVFLIFAGVLFSDSYDMELEVEYANCDLLLDPDCWYATGVNAGLATSFWFFAMLFTALGVVSMIVGITTMVLDWRKNKKPASGPPSWPPPSRRGPPRRRD